MRVCWSQASIDDDTVANKKRRCIFTSGGGGMKRKSSSKTMTACKDPQIIAAKVRYIKSI